MHTLRRLLAVLFTVSMLTASAYAATIENVEYTNVSGTTTQDAILSYVAEITEPGKAAQPWHIEVLDPDDFNVDVLTDIYNFVLTNDVRPARYFSEEVQQEIRDIINADPDILHMTEFIEIQPDPCETEEGEAKVWITCEVDYQPGELIVVMFGDVDAVDFENFTEEEFSKIDWTPLAAEVTETGIIEFVIPNELVLDIQGQDTLFTVLSDRAGGRGGASGGAFEDQNVESVPSKNAGDMTSVSGAYYSKDEQEIPDEFRIYITEMSEQMLDEVDRIVKFTVQDEEDPEDDMPIIRWFADEVRDEAALLLEEGFDMDTLVAYEIKALAAENYVDTYGDVLATICFATPYQPGQQVVAVLGVPKENPEEIPEGESLFDYTVLRAEAGNDEVGITFKELLIPEMEKQSLMLIVLSEPLETENGQ